ncbi:hypothetical protein D3C75_1140670 [compost metagenome]
MHPDIGRPVIQRIAEEVLAAVRRNRRTRVNQRRCRCQLEPVSRIQVRYRIRINEFGIADNFVRVAWNARIESVKAVVIIGHSRTVRILPARPVIKNVIGVVRHSRSAGMRQRPVLRT